MLESTLMNAPARLRASAVVTDAASVRPGRDTTPDATLETIKTLKTT